VAVGVVCGVIIAAHASAAVLTGIFGIVAAVVVFYMLFTREGWHPVEGLPDRAGQAAMASTIGAVSALMGIGGGTLTVPTLSICSDPVRRAVGTASVIGLIIAIPGTVGYIINGWARPTCQRSRWVM